MLLSVRLFESKTASNRDIQLPTMTANLNTHQFDWLEASMSALWPETANKLKPMN